MKNHRFIEKSTALLLAVVLCVLLSSCGNKPQDTITHNETEQDSTEQSGGDSKHFVIGEELVCGNKLPFNFPLIKSQNIVATIDSMKIEKYKECDINNADDFILHGYDLVENPKEGDDVRIQIGDDLQFHPYYYKVGYLFFKYQYKITICGKTDTKLAGKSFYFLTDVNEHLTIPSKLTLFDDGYAESRPNTFMLTVEEDGSFSNEYIVYSDENLNEYSIIGFLRFDF